MLSTCAVFVWQSRHRGVAQFGRAPRSGRGGRGFKSRHLDQRDAGLNFALGSALFISSAQLCVAQLCSAHRTRGLIWLKVPMRDAGPKFALGSASLFVCTVVRCATVQCAQDEWFSMAQNFILSVSGALNFRVLMLSGADVHGTRRGAHCAGRMFVQYSEDFQVYREVFDYCAVI